MADILNNLSKYFKIKKYKLFTTKVDESINFQDVYISWKAPINW